MTFPALFAYEQGEDADARVGWITRIQTRGRDIRIEYQIEETLPPISSADVVRLEWELEIENYELSQTHWAVKDVDLLPVLVEAGLIKDDSIRSQPAGSKVIRLGMEKAVTELYAHPSVFRIPPTKPDDDLVSVMMPFDGKFDGVYRAIEAACGKVRLKCLRADNVWEAEEVIQDVFGLIYRSRIVVCDFSERNPNVFYETGIAHTLGRPVIPIVQDERDVPFDVRHHRFIKYLNNGEGHKLLTERIARRLDTLHSYEAPIVQASSRMPHFAGPAFDRQATTSKVAALVKLKEAHTIITVVGIGHKLGTVDRIGDRNYKETAECKVVECDSNSVHLFKISSNINFSEPLDHVQISQDHNKHRPMLVITGY